MPIDVRGPDGTIYRVNTDDENVARETVRRQLSGQRRNMPRSSSPTGARPGAQTVTPNTPYQQAQIRRNARRSEAPLAMFADQMFRNMGVGDEIAGAADYLGQGAENLVRRARGQDIQIPANVAAQAAIDSERQQHALVARDRPLLNAGSIAASIPAFAGAPGAAIPRMGMLQAGGTAAVIDAPFALARQEGDLMERLPGAARETAAVGLFGTALQGAANRFLRPPVANSTARRAQEFEQAGVRAPLAAVQARGHAPMAMAIAENPIGGNVRRHLQNSVDDVEAAARGLTARAGTAEPREITGEVIQRAAQRFAGRNAPRPSADPATTISTRNWSFGAKANALYDDVFARLAADERAMVGAVNGPVLDLQATMRVMDDIDNAIHGPASRAVMESTDLARMRQALQSDQRLGELRFQDLRRWRTWVREAQKNEGLRQSIGNANLQRLEGALTEDIYASARLIGGKAAEDLFAIDRWYRRINNRIISALEPLEARPGFGGAQAYRRIVDLASQGGRQSSQELRRALSVLRPAERRTVAATVMDNLGRPSFGAANAMDTGAFSLEHFVTNVAKLSPEGRRTLFGPQLAQELENLARVAGYLKGVRGFANYSRSGSSIQNMSTLTAAGGAAVAAGTGNFAPLAMLTAAGLTARITGEMLTNPAFVRWLTRPGGGGMRRQLAALATIAARDPAVAPLYGELAQRAADRSRAPEGQQAERTGSSR